MRAVLDFVEGNFYYDRGLHVHGVFRFLGSQFQQFRGDFDELSVGEAFESFPYNHILSRRLVSNTEVVIAKPALPAS
jgi:hypothetical protein